MAIRPILVAPNPILKTASAPVAQVDDEVRRLMDDMLETMYAAPGVGLSAIQIGVPKRIVVIDAAKDPEPPAPLRLVNPEVVWTSDERALREEGCLSFPDEYEEVERPLAVEVAYLDETGTARRIRAEGLLAIALQHEIDHLDGVLLVDHLSLVKRNIIMRRMKKQQRLGLAAE